LKRDAEEKQISFNTLANQIFDSYVKFANSAKTNMMPTPKALISERARRDMTEYSTGTIFEFLV